ncbi:MAG: hypothetical protein QNK04_18340 [Myxococcota bacterium]|nr:hypothetical protein [Myxococcota bacterium]
MAGSGYLFKALDQYLEFAKDSSKRWQDALLKIKDPTQEYGPQDLMKDTVEQWESALGVLWFPYGADRTGVPVVSAQIQAGDSDTTDKTVVLAGSPANVTATDLREIGGTNTYTGKLSPSFDAATTTLTIDFQSLQDIAVGQYIASVYEAPNNDPVVIVHLLVTA